MVQPSFLHKQAQQRVMNQSIVTSSYIVVHFKQDDLKILHS